MTRFTMVILWGILCATASLASAWVAPFQAHHLGLRPQSTQVWTHGKGLNEIGISVVQRALPLHAIRTTSCRGGSLSVQMSGDWMESLKFGGSTPSFDVIAKTKEYTSQPGYRSFVLKQIPAEYYADDYVFRGPVIGPINRKDLVETNSLLGTAVAFPDLDRQAFGFTVDPENPYRVMYFERWKATHTGPLDLANLGVGIPPTGKQSVSPAFPFSLVWNPDGKIIYEHLSPAVDRFEGNTNGKVAVFGLFETAGLPLDSNVGNPALVFAQKFNRFLNRPAQIYSRAEDLPSWWKSKAVGAEANDM